MTDIVERLRQCLKANADIGGNVVLYSPVKDDDIREAAAEIETLREALSQILDVLEGLGPNPYPVEAAEEIARAALKEQI